MLKWAAIFISTFAFLQIVNAQVKAVDYTKANSAFNKGYTSSKENDFNSKKFSDSSKRYSTFKAYESGRISRDSDKSSYWSENPQSSRFSSMKFYDANKSYSSPEFAEYKNSDMWSKASNKPHFDNADRDLNKKYIGKIDVEKRHSLSSKYRADYEDHIERSMSDINKYYSRAPKDDEKGVPIRVAGEDINKKDESILDLLDFTSKEVKGNAGKIVLPKALSAKPIDEDGNFISPPDVKKSNSQNLKQSNVRSLPQQTNVIEEENFDKRTGKIYGSDAPIQLQRGEVKEIKTDYNFQGLGIPEEMKGGKTTIKVQIKN